MSYSGYKVIVYVNSNRQVHGMRQILSKLGKPKSRLKSADSIFLPFVAIEIYPDLRRIRRLLLFKVQLAH